VISHWGSWVLSRVLPCTTRARIGWHSISFQTLAKPAFDLIHPLCCFTLSISWGILALLLFLLCLYFAYFGFALLFFF
jgi:hypothetical protein